MNAQINCERAFEKYIGLAGVTGQNGIGQNGIGQNVKVKMSRTKW